MSTDIELLNDDVHDSELFDDEDVQYSACDAELFIFKDLMQHLAHPFFSLSKRPSSKEITYQSGKDWLKIQPGIGGRATIYDKDILVYIISQLIQKEKNNEPISRHVSLNPAELLKATNRGVGGKDYKALLAALDRLTGTRMQTNIVQGGVVETSAYGMVDGYKATRKDDKIDGRMIGLQVSLSIQLFNSIRTKKELLTVNPEYFKLSKPIEKKIYEIARKHVGRKTSYTLNLSTLHTKSGSENTLREMRRSVKKLIESHNAEGTFPDYIVDYSKEKDQVTFTQKHKWWERSVIESNFEWPQFLPSAYEDAREAAPKLCPYYLEGEFKQWVMKTPKRFKLDRGSLTTTYINFCKKKATSK